MGPQAGLILQTTATTGTLVPLLHIVPSKTDAERLIPMTPELVTVLVAVQRRAKGGNDQVPRCGNGWPAAQRPATSTTTLRELF